MVFLFKLFVCIFLLSFFSSIQAEYFFKNLQGPPSEFSSFPGSNEKRFTPETSSAATIPFSLEKGSFTTTFLVDSHKSFGFCSISPIESQLEYSFSIPDFPSDLSIDDMLNVLDGSHFNSTLAIGLAFSYPSDCYEFSSPVVGSWNVTISSQDYKQKTGTYTGIFLLWNDSPFKIKSSASYDIAVGDDVQLDSQIYDHIQGRNLINTNPELAFSSHAIVINPSGTQQVIRLTDNSSEYEQVLDGIFNGQFPVRERGVYQVTTVYEGFTPDGLPFRRTTDQVMRAIQSKINLHETVTAKTVGDYFQITLKIDLLEHESDELVAYSQVWGTSSSSGQEVPIAWISGITKGAHSHTGKKDQFTLSLHHAWIEKANATAPFTLRQLHISSKGASVTLAQRQRVSIYVDQPLLSLLSKPHLRNIDFTEEMYNGPRPSHLHMSNKRGDNSGKKILVHGYCSDALAWPKEDFTDYIYFSDPNADRKIDEFARLVMQFANSSGVSSYSIIAHSQGGLVGLHIATYYWSGLDLATGGNVLTSVGSPYHGTVMAGTLASIGWVFGLGCGANDDLTPDGAEAWLSKIPQSKKSLVHYYTTNSNEPSCSRPSNWVGLDLPNDGVVAVSYGQLEGATNEGNYNGWCHTATMSSPFQCSDKERNAKINMEAAL